MNRIFTKVEREMKESYFPALKMTGVSGIIMPCDKIFSSNIHFAKKYDMPVWVEFDATEAVESQRIDYGTYGIFYREAKIITFAFDKFKEFVLSIPKADISLIDGFKIPCPVHSGMLWDESFKTDFFNEFSNYIEDYLPVLFEHFENKTAFRYWYYEKCQSFMYDRFIKPCITWAKRRNLNISLDIGEEKTHFFYFIDHISILDMLEKGISLSAHHEKDGICEISLLLSQYGDNNFIYTKEADERLDGLDISIVGSGSDVEKQIKGDKILFVKCDRAIAENHIDYENIFYFSNECISLYSSFEATYLTDKLHEKGFDFVITNEKYFEKHTKYKNGKLTYKDAEIDQVLLCKKCVVSDKMFNLLSKLKKDGVCVNNSNLIKILESDLI